MSSCSSSGLVQPLKNAVGVHVVPAVLPPLKGQQGVRAAKHALPSAAAGQVLSAAAAVVGAGPSEGGELPAKCFWSGRCLRCRRNAIVLAVAVAEGVLPLFFTQAFCHCFFGSGSDGVLPLLSSKRLQTRRTAPRRRLLWTQPLSRESLSVFLSLLIMYGM